MPDPTPDPAFPIVRRVALRALGAGVLFFIAKLIVYALTNSAAVLSDALESTINVVAAGAMLYTLWLSNRPPDESHPYGHGKAEFLAVALEGSMILLAGALIIISAAGRLFDPPPLRRLDAGLIGLAVIAVAGGAIALYVLHQGKRHRSMVLTADGKHLLTDLLTTVGVIAGLLLVRLTGYAWLDPLIALAVAGFIFFTGWRLLRESTGGLMDQSDANDLRIIADILEREAASGAIRGFHKVRARHTGAFHWVDFHIQVDPSMSVERSHAIASRIEGWIEEALGQADATAHVEPASGVTSPAPSSP